MAGACRGVTILGESRHLDVAKRLPIVEPLLVDATLKETLIRQVEALTATGSGEVGRMKWGRIWSYALMDPLDDTFPSESLPLVL